MSYRCVVQFSCFLMYISTLKKQVYTSSTFFFDVHIGQNSQNIFQEKKWKMMYDVYSKMSILESVSDFFFQNPCRDFFFLVYTSITFWTRVGPWRSPKNTLIFCRRVHQFLKKDDISTSKNKCTHHQLFFLVYTSDKILKLFFWMGYVNHQMPYRHPYRILESVSIYVFVKSFWRKSYYCFW